MREAYGAGSVLTGDTESFGHDTLRGGLLHIRRLGSGDGAALSMLASSKVLGSSRNRMR